MKSILTVFTPAYNRAHTLGRCYESLCRQSNKSFKWLIIDDGSSDNTKALVDNWILETNDFEIVYVYKQNGGMHTAHNTAYDHIDTELNVCIDSDDCLADGAVDAIINTWEKIRHDGYAGIIGLDSDLKGNLIGRPFQDNHIRTTLGDYYANGGSGDKKLVYKTDIINQYPRYPIFKGEKYVGLNYLYTLIDQDYKLYTLNKVLCNVEYQADGSSATMWRQYLENPNGFAFLRETYMRYPTSNKKLLMNTIHYISSKIIGGSGKNNSEISS